jgi:glyoxylase-like metal-dependent hydrolase (beta-lactamase superfamily II)
MPPAYLHSLALPTPFPVGPVNVYLAEGDPLTLIDTGPLHAASLAALEAALAARGRRVEDIGVLLITHHHVDHLGLAAEIARRSGAEICTHPFNFPWLADYEAERRRQQPFYQAIWQQSGVPAAITEAMRAASQGMSRYTEPAAAGRALEDGQSFPLGGQDWRVLHTPGHAGGLICLWEPSSRTLLASDHLIRDISSNPILEPPLTNGPRPRRLVEYLAHLRRVAALEPVIALPGHGEPVEDVGGLVRQRAAFHARRASRILDAMGAGECTLWELTQPLFPRLTRGMDFFLALSEVLGHLDLLEDEGRAAPHMQAGIVRWRRL